jgi:hypothetical protein
MPAELHAPLGLSYRNRNRGPLLLPACPDLALTGTLFRLDVREFHHLAPLLGFCGNKLAEFGGWPGSAATPKSEKRAIIFGSEMPALISLLSLSMIAAGVFRGAPTPSEELAS